MDENSEDVSTQFIFLELSLFQLYRAQGKHRDKSIPSWFKPLTLI